MHTQSSDVPIKSDRLTGDSSNVAFNQTIKLAGKKKTSVIREGVYQSWVR